MRREDPGYYDILGVAPGAGQAAVSAAYRALMRRYHPDAALGDPSAPEAMAKRINEAFAVLGDPERRLVYDADYGYGRLEAEPPAPPPRRRGRPAPAPRRQPARARERDDWAPPESVHGGPAMLVFALLIAGAAVVLVVILIALAQEQRAGVLGWPG